MSGMIKLNISRGNKKMGAIPSFSLPAGKTCSALACKTCYKQDCYGKAMEMRLPAVRNSYAQNLENLQRDLEGCRAFLNWYFDGPNAPRLFRIHVVGDFYSYEYFIMWLDVIRRHPDTHFIAFTKQFDVIMTHVLVLGLPVNLTLIASAWPGVEIPEWVQRTMPIAWMQDGTEYRVPDTAYLCDGDCSGACRGHCWNMNPGDSVVFEKHGPGIKKNKKARE